MDPVTCETQYFTFNVFVGELDFHTASLVPRPLPDYISPQLQDKIFEWPGDESRVWHYLSLYRFEPRLSVLDFVSQKVDYNLQLLIFDWS